MNDIFTSISDKHFYSTENQQYIMNSIKNLISKFSEAELVELNTKN
jgi:hypothetical protein